jgi:YbgC/YbaW family acyl-CoA thioester hydrolase
MQINTIETVQFYDTDCGGVVSNIAYLRWIEKARSVLMAGLGLELSGMMSSGLFPTVVRTEIDYLRAARLGDEIRVEATLAEVGRVRMVCRFALLQGAGTAPACLATATQTVALVLLPSGKPQRLPLEWVSRVKVV